LHIYSEFELVFISVLLVYAYLQNYLTSPGTLI